MNKCKYPTRQLPEISEHLASLIDRLEACSLRKYPNRLWSIDFYFECAFAWQNDLTGLEQRVLKLEAELSEK